MAGGLANPDLAGADGLIDGAAAVKIAAQLGGVPLPDHIPGVALRRAGERGILLIGGLLRRLPDGIDARLRVKIQGDRFSVCVQDGHPAISGCPRPGLPQDGPPAQNALGEVPLRRRLGELNLAVHPQLLAVDQHPMAVQGPDQEGVGGQLQQQLHLTQLPGGCLLLRLAGQSKGGHAVRPRLHQIPPVAGQPGGGLHQGQLLARHQLLQRFHKPLPVPLQPSQVKHPAPVGGGKEIVKDLLADMLGLGRFIAGEPGPQQGKADQQEHGQQRQQKRI